MTPSENKSVSRRDFIKTGLLVGGGLGRHFYNVFGGKDYDQMRTETLINGVRVGNPNELPNIILIMTDDMGLGDLSLTGSQAIRTPSIDRMAA